jgi:hypothetical protein
MNWTRILSEAGVPEPPGRAEALVAPTRQWLATLRRKKNGVIVDEQLTAPSYHVALMEVRKAFKDCTVVMLRECELS